MKEIQSEFFRLSQHISIKIIEDVIWVYSDRENFQASNYFFNENDRKYCLLKLEFRCIE